MLDRKPIPVGTEDFKELIDKGYCFVDKTLLIKDNDIIQQYRYLCETEQERWEHTLIHQMKDSENQQRTRFILIKADC